MPICSSISSLDGMKIAPSPLSRILLFLGGSSLWQDLVKRLPKSLRDPILGIAHTREKRFVQGLPKIKAPVIDESHGSRHANLCFQPKINRVLEFDGGEDLPSRATDQPDVHHRLEKSARLTILDPTACHTFREELLCTPRS